MELQHRTKKRKHTESFSLEVTPDLIVNSIGSQNFPDDHRRKTRKRFSFEEKKNILEEMNQYSPDVIREKYELSDRTLRKWKSQKEDIIQEAAKNNCKQLKKKTNAEEMDSAMFQWLVETQEKGIPISGPMVRQQALILNQNLHLKDDKFKASEGWLSGFKERIKIRSSQITDDYTPDGTNKKFKVLSDTFGNIIRDEQCPSGSARKNKSSKWAHYDAMQFLGQHFAATDVSNCESEDNMSDEDNVSVHEDDNGSTSSRNSMDIRSNEEKSNDKDPLASVSINETAEASSQQNINLSSSPEPTEIDACLLIIRSRLNKISKQKQSEAIQKMLVLSYEVYDEFKDQ